MLIDSAEAVLGLLRNPQYCMYAASSSSTEKDADRAERAFGSMSFEERAKVKTETLVNSAGMGVRTAQVSGKQRYACLNPGLLQGVYLLRR